MDYIADENIDIKDVCVSKSRLLTFLGNEFGNLLTSFCVDERVGTVFHTSKVDMQTLVSCTLYANHLCAANSPSVDTSFLNRRVHEVIKHQKSQCSDRCMKLAFDVHKFVSTVRSLAPEFVGPCH